MEGSSGKKRNIGGQLDALTMNLELMSHANEAQDRRIERLTASIEKLVEVSNRDAIGVGALARIAEAHERQLRIEGGLG